MFARMLKKVVVYLILVAVILAPTAVWSISVGNPLDYVAYTLPPGQSLYVVAKFAGLLALSAFWVQCLLGLARRTPVLRGIPPVSMRFHRWLGYATLILVLAHVGLFFVAASMRAGTPAWNLLWPNFGHGYYNACVSLGLIALWCLLLAAYAGWRTSRGQQGWKMVHMLWFVVFALVFLHAYAIGSESRVGAMRYVLLFMTTGLVATSWSRLRMTRKKGRPAAGGASEEAVLERLRDGERA